MPERARRDKSVQKKSLFSESGDFYMNDKKVSEDGVRKMLFVSRENR